MIAQLIEQHARATAEAGDWVAVAGILNNLSRRVTDSTLRDSRWLMGNFRAVIDQATGATEADLILGTLQAATVPRIKAAYQTLCAGGLDLSDDQVQEMLPLVGAAASWPSDLTLRLMQSGVRHEPLIAATTAEECRVAWETVTLEAAWAQCLNEGINAAVSSGNRSALVTALRSAADELEVG